ncbi:hypothetical protein BGZ51_006082 [Haplosporangium sp. Z 767]|nr:hypothetical protein BGZ51_006082 [Haplosporangium sp. Z 767]
MNLIDQSLDDIIELQKLERKQKQARNAARKPNALTRVSNNGRLATSHLLYASDQIIVPPKEEPSKSPDAMDTDDVIVIKGMAPLGADLAIKGESGPATIEIHNLDPGTSAEDVKVVCSRFGEIRSCICSNGVAQVTYVRKPAGAAAVENLDGKKADNDQILKVIMLRHPVFHTIPNISHQPTFVPGPLNLLVKAVQGTISNPGTAYSIQVQAARRILELQQNRVNQLRDKAQSVEALQMQEQSIETQREELMREYM